MSLLQDPNRALDQIDWYLANRQHECFPGAFVRAAGNLGRQVLEQILFILAFYGGAPRNKYLRANGQLRTANEILIALRQSNPTTGKTYLEHARKCSRRIQKFARSPRTLDKWRRLFNETSHFRNPAARTESREADILEFVQRLRAILDLRDPHLITAAFNELRSHGKTRAVIRQDAQCTPGIESDIVVSAKHLVVENGHLALKSGPLPVRVVPDTHDVPHRWPNVPVIVQHSAGISIGARLITKDGQAVDLTSFETILRCLGKTENERKQLRRRLRKLGYDVEWK